MPFTLPEGWEWCKLGSLCSSIRYGLSNSAESSGTHKLLRITDIQNGSVNWDTVPYTTTEDPETYILKSDDIVFARTGATVGKSFLIDQLPYKSVYASFLIRIRLLKFISPQYIYNFFNSPCYLNNPVSVSLLSGDRKPQIRFWGNHHSGSGNLYHKSFRM